MSDLLREEIRPFILAIHRQVDRDHFDSPGHQFMNQEIPTMRRLGRPMNQAHPQVYLPLLRRRKYSATLSA